MFRFTPEPNPNYGLPDHYPKVPAGTDPVQFYNGVCSPVVGTNSQFVTYWQFKDGNTMNTMLSLEKKNLPVSDGLIETIEHMPLAPPTKKYEKSCRMTPITQLSTWGQDWENKRAFQNLTVDKMEEMLKMVKEMTRHLTLKWAAPAVLGEFDDLGHPGWQKYVDLMDFISKFKMIEEAAQLALQVKSMRTQLGEEEGQRIDEELGDVLTMMD
ncbi:hypothetical protein KEM56_004420 [Ascosphaera pollenicola]|nr:hypothetical protein KEM56_004420 [Ascosphaera pollenicola]